MTRIPAFGMMIICFTLAIIILPVFGGLLGVLLPALGYFPALGYDAFSGDAFTAFLDNPASWRGMFHALYIGLIASLLSVLFVFVILSAGTQAGMGQKLMIWHRRLMGPLIALPHSTIAIALLFLLAPSGWLVRLISPELTGWSRPPPFGFVPDQTGWLLIIGLMSKEIPFLLFIALSQSQRLAIKNYQQLGASFSYHPIVVWALIIWPQIYAQMRLPMLAVLAYSLSVVDMALILGPTLPPPLSVLVLQGFHDADLSARLPASAGASLQIALIIVGITLWLIGERIMRALTNRLLAHGKRLSLLPAISKFLFSVISLMFFLVCLGLLAIALWAFSSRWSFRDKIPSDFGLRYWDFDLAFGTLVADTMVIAIGASLLAIAICVLWLEHIAAHKKAISLITILLFIPLFVPQISLLFGLQVALSWSYLDGYLATVLFTHLLYILPYVWLTLAPAYQGHDPNYMHLAYMMGYSRVRAFISVRLPMLGHSFASAMILGVAVSIALYLPTIFAGSGKVNTVTVEAVTLAAGGARGPSASAAMMQMLLPFCVFLLVRLLVAWRYKGLSLMQSHRQL